MSENFFVEESFRAARAGAALPYAAGGGVRWNARWALPWAFPILLLVVLEILVRSGVLESRLMPAPSTVAATLWELAGRDLFRHIAVSAGRVFAGFVLGAGLAIVAALAIGLSRKLERFFDPTFQALRAIPSLAWVPLLLLWMGIDEAPKITLIAIGAFFPVYLNLLAGIHNVDRKLVELGESFGLSRAAMIRRIFLPAASPNLFTGLRAGLGLSWMFLVAAELIAATSGLGYLLSDGRETGRPDIVLAAIFLLGVLGKLSDSALKWAERRKLAWRDSYDPASNNG
jgi:sulfonate transport system permease protein